MKSGKHHLEERRVKPGLKQTAHESKARQPTELALAASPRQPAARGGLSVRALRANVMDAIRQFTRCSHIDLRMNLLSDLGMNSLTFIRLVAELERKADVRFEEDHLSLHLFPTVEHLCLYAEARKRAV